MQFIIQFWGFFSKYLNIYIQKFNKLMFFSILLIIKVYLLLTKNKSKVEINNKVKKKLGKKLMKSLREMIKE